MIFLIMGVSIGGSFVVSYPPMGGTDMEHDRYWSWLLVFLSAAVMVLSGCSTGGDTAREDPVQDSDLAGVWVGWFDATKAQPAFCVGMIVDDGDGYTARFIGDDRQYVSPIIGLFGTVFPFDVQPLEATSGTGFFFGDLAEFAWTGSGQDYATNVEKIYLSGTVAAKNSLGLPWGGRVQVLRRAGRPDERHGCVRLHLQHHLRPGPQRAQSRREVGDQECLAGREHPASDHHP